MFMRRNGELRGRKAVDARLQKRFCDRRGASESVDFFKHGWLAKELAEVMEPELQRRLQRAGEESASLAWMSGFPQLLLPELLEEKGREARLQFERQQAIRKRSEARISFAA
jgi:hypothetical protein